MASQYEQDQARRAKAPAKKEPARSIPKGWLAVGAVAVAALVVFAVVGRDTDVADTYAENFAAFRLADDPVMGDPDAPVVLVGYESPRCSACRQFHLALLPDLVAEFIDTGDVAYYYIQGTIGDDLHMSMAQECAYKHDGAPAFWHVTGLFYADASHYNGANEQAILRQAGEEMGLDSDPWVACLRDGDTRAKVSQDWNVGREFGATGTPTFFVFGAEGEAAETNAQGLEAVLRDRVLARPSDNP